MISIEESVCKWPKSHVPPTWSLKTVWLNPDHIVSIEVTDCDEEFRGTDVNQFTKVHTTKTRYLTTEPADELARRLFDKVTRI